MLTFFISYRKNYLWVFPIIITCEFLCFYFKLHEASKTYFLNTLKILTSGITVLAFTISLVEIAMNKKISRIAETAANEAKTEVKKSILLVNSARADFQIEMIRNSLENEEYKRCNDQFKEIKKVIQAYTTNKQNDTVHLLIEKIDTTRSKLSIAITDSVAQKKKVSLSNRHLQVALDLLAKLDTFINEKTKV